MIIFKKNKNRLKFALYVASCVVIASLLSTIIMTTNAILTKEPRAIAHTDHSIEGVCGPTHMTCIEDPKHGKCKSNVQTNIQTTPNGSNNSWSNCIYPTFMDNFISNGTGKPIDDPPDDTKARWSCLGVNGGKTNQCEVGAVVTPTTPVSTITPTPTPTPTPPSTTSVPTPIRECHKSFMGWWDWCAVVPTARYVLTILLGIFGSVAVLMIIWGGILYITSGGDPDKTKKAKNVILFTILGIVIVTATWGLISLTASLIGAV